MCVTARSQFIVNQLISDAEHGDLAKSLDRDQLYRQVRNLARNSLRDAKGPLVLESSADLLEWGRSNRFPPNIENCAADAMYVLPHGYRADLQAIVFSSKNILTNLNRARKGRPEGFSIMVDGTFKLHYGGWALIIAGVTTLSWCSRGSGLSQSFRPVAYCFAQSESGDAVTLLLDAMKTACCAYFDFDLSPVATHADKSLPIDNALAASFPLAKRTTCWSHVSRKFTEGSFKGDASVKTLRSFSPMIDAIHNCRTLEQAKAVGDIVIRQMEAAGAPDTARIFKKEYLSERWLNWYCGVVGPGYPPNTNAQESYHLQLKSQVPRARLRRATDELLHTHFPQMLQRDGTWLCDDNITMKTPDVMPSEFVHEAMTYKQRAEKNPRHVLMWANDVYYVKENFVGNLADKTVTKTWVTDYEKALKGDINPHATMDRVRSHFQGLCKVSLDEAGLPVTCDCHLFIRYMCCPHLVFVRDRQGNLSLDELTTQIGRVRKAGGARKAKRALEEQGDTPEKKKPARPRVSGARNRG